MKRKACTATQSMYPADVCAALEAAGFNIILSAPSKSAAWPICEQKRDLILMARRVIRSLERMRMMPAWVEQSLDLLQNWWRGVDASRKSKDCRFKLANNC